MLSCVCACTCVCVVDRWIGFSKEHTYTHAPIQYFPEIHMKNKETQFGAKKRRNCKYTCQTWRYEPVLKHTITHKHTHTCENRESGKLEKWKINNKKKHWWEWCMWDWKDRSDGDLQCIRRVRLPSTGQRQNYNISGKKGRKSSLQFTVFVSWKVKWYHKIPNINRQ